MSYYASVQLPSLPSTCCRHANVKHCLGLDFLIDYKVPFSKPPQFPQSVDSFHSFLSPYQPYMSFNFSNIGNSTPSVSSSHSFTPSFGPNPLSFPPSSGTNPSPFTGPLPGSNSSSFTPSSHSPYTPAGTSHPLSHGRDSNVDPNLDSEAVSARFIDILANQFSFGDQEQDLRCNLHGFAKVCTCVLIVNIRFKVFADGARPQ